MSNPLRDAIVVAYLELCVDNQDWIRLARIRPLVNAPREMVDAELLAMMRGGSVHLAPDSNRKVLTEEDHAAAIRFGNEDHHLLAIEDDFFEG